MAVIRYKDSHGNIITLNSIKGDRGPAGPRGFSGPKGPKGDKGGTIIKGSRPTFNDLLEDQPALNLEIGDGYLIEEDNSLYIWDGEKWIHDNNYIPVKLEDLTNVTIDNSILDNSTVLVYDVNLKTWTNKILDVDAGLLSTSEDIIVSVPNGIGGYNEGDLISTGTTFNDFVKTIVHKTIPPIYIYPELSLSIDMDNIEIGSFIEPIIYLDYKQNDAGEFKTCKIYRNGLLIDMYTEYHNEIKINPYLLDRDSFFRIDIEYEDGNIKNDSDNNPYPEGSIKSSIISSEISLHAVYPYWSYITNRDEAPNPDSIQSLGTKEFNLKKEDSISLESIDSTKTIVFVYPKFLGECNEIDYVGFDKRNKDVFIKDEVEILTPSGSSSISYYVYYYIAPIEIGPATFVLKV